MIGLDELNAGLDIVRDMQQNGPTWGDYVEGQGFDPNAILDCGCDHADTLADMQMIKPAERPNHMVSFGAGFTLAVVVMHMMRERENA